MTAKESPGRVPRKGRLSRRARMLPYAVLGEVGIAILAYFLYFVVRGLTEASYGRALGNAERIVEFESRLGIFWERDLQGWIERNGLVLDVLNGVYIWGHWPVIGAVALWLLLKHPVRYRLVRNGFLISGAIGLVVFATFPVAPPRLMDLGFADTVTERSELYRSFQPGALVNKYAAMPSLHFGWNLLMGIALVRYSSWTALRVAGAVLPAAMAAAVVLTANHFFVDVVAGGALALAGYEAAELMQRCGRRRAAGERIGSRKDDATRADLRTTAHGGAPGGE